MRDLGRADSLKHQRPRRNRYSDSTLPLFKRIALLLGISAIISCIGWFGWNRLQILKSEAGFEEEAIPVPDGSNPVFVAPITEPGQSLEDAILEDQKQEYIGSPETKPQVFGPANPFERISVRLSSGQTLVQALEEGGVKRSEANRVVQALKSHVDFRKLRPGDHFEGILWLGDSLIEGTFYHGKLGRFELDGRGRDIAVSDNPIAVSLVTTVVKGLVETSLFEAIYAANERPSLIMSFIDLFSWDFDFNVSTRAGDQFEMLVEKKYIGDEFYGYGPIIAGRYRAGTQSYEACWFQPNEEIAGYYHRDGSSVKGAFLRAPLKYSRISSRFTLRRFHPVLKINRPHRGVDYAAPMGTPVYAVSSGYVLDARRMGGAGRAVRIKHPNGWITSYSHLSRILVRKGQRVKQGQMIGKVGSSGYSTGPHLDYRVKVRGKFVDPLRIKYPKGKSVPAPLMASFSTQCDAQLAQLDGTVEFADVSDALESP